MSFSKPTFPFLSSLSTPSLSHTTTSSPSPVPAKSVITFATDPATKEKTFSDTLSFAAKKALGGGVPGAIAMGLQVGLLMWLRTATNYQYKHGMGTVDAIKTLYKEGGVRRFYRGVGPALIQGPMSRFGDTAANAGVLAVLESEESTKTLPTAVKTAMASGTAALWRVVLMPVDAMKTTLQVQGASGLNVLQNKVSVGGPRVLFHGAGAAFAATAAGHYPWFLTFNYLNATLAQDVFGSGETGQLGRNALMGFTSSVVSDTVSNSIRVMKTTKQTSDVPITYPEALQQVLKQGGVISLFGRGLRTKIITNGLQGMLFSVLWRKLQKMMDL